MMSPNSLQRITQALGVPAGLEAMAFQAGHQWEIVVINLTAAGSATASIDLALPGGGALRAAGSYQTSATRDLAPAGNAAIHGGSATLTTPAQSITTFLINQNG
jgi:O-glycosyl hydrolase